ncbi:MAG TPA: hypothetical protein EYG73_01850 [Arcobacter sp.]|nr:hypothetical protein [Arcobacter sp.]
MNYKSISLSIVFYNLFIVVFILSIPHTQSIRNIAFYSAFLLITYIFIQGKYYNNSIFKSKELKKIAIAYILLSIWIVIGLLFFAENQLYVLKEIKGQWIVPFLYFLFGMFCYLISFNSNSKLFNHKNIMFIIFFALFIHVLYIDLYALQYYTEHKELIKRFGGLEGTPDRANMLTNLLLALIMTEIVYRIRNKKQLLPLNNFVLFISFVLTIISSLIEAMRNGSVAVLFLATSSLVFILYKNQQIKQVYKYILSSIFIAVLALPFMYNVKTDARWQTLIESIPIALDTQNNKFWLNSSKYPSPKLDNGQNVNGSNYLRIAWFKVGIEYSIEKPFGIGYQRNSFGEAMTNKYNYHARSTSHSGFIDWLLGIGYIGIILWFIIIGLLFRLAIHSYRKNFSYFSVGLFFVVTGNMSRFMVDPILRDHMFATFMLIVGIMLTGLLLEDNEKTKTNKSQ